MRRFLPALLLATCAVARAQDEPIDPILFLEGLSESYRARPFAERVVVALTRSGSTIRRSIVLRAEPGGAAGPSRLRLELGDLRAFATPDRLVAAHVADPTRCLVRDLPGELTPGVLAEVFPALPLPQLALLLSSPPVDLIEHAQETVWASASLSRQGPLRLVILAGTCASGEVTLIATLEDLRLRSFRISSPEAKLELSFRDIDPGEPETWAIDPQGRALVPALQDLRTSPGVIPPGVRLPEWLVRTKLGPETEPFSDVYLRAGAPRPGFTAVVVVRVTADPGIAEVIEADAGSGLNAAFACEGITRGVLGAVELSAGTPERVETFLGHWSDRARGSPVAWHHSPSLTLGRLMPGRDACLAVIDSGGRLVGTIALDGREGDVEGIRADLDAMIASWPVDDR